MKGLLRRWREWRDARNEYSASLEEMQYHVEQETAHNLRNGMSPENARRAADQVCGDGRVLMQGHVAPNNGAPETTIDAMAAHGEGSGQARRIYDDAVALMGAGKDKAAFKEFARAYQQATK